MAGWRRTVAIYSKTDQSWSRDPRHMPARGHMPTLRGRLTRHLACLAECRLQPVLIRLYVKTTNPGCVKVEDMTDPFVAQPMSLILQWQTGEIAHGLTNLDDD